jgi:hypothetical protein
MLLQAKYRADRRRPASVTLPDELRKCALLKDCDDTRALRGLHAMWRGRLPTSSGRRRRPRTAGRAAAADPLALRKQQRSAAFPENLLSQPDPSDGISYLEIPPGGPVDQSLPSLPAVLDLSFVVATNADRINVTLAAGYHLTISEKALDATLQVDTGRLADPGSRLAWESFLASVREGVSVKFLFTSAS